jgi:iron complex outermembrane receptor protein
MTLPFAPIGAARVDTGRIEGRVTLEDGRPLPGVRVTISQTSVSTDTDSDGRYSLRKVTAGTYSLTFSWRNETATRSEVIVEADSTTTIDEVVSWEVGLIEEVTVTAVSRRPERIVEAPASVTAISADEIERQSSHGQVPKLFEFTPGVDITQINMVDFLINTRGFNSGLNRRVAVLVDGRDMTDPFVGAMEWTTISYPLDDFADLELVRGPTAALYGANATSGIVNLTTKQPRDSQGGLLRLAVGEQDSTNVDFRWAGGLGQDWYVKVVGGTRKTDGFTESRLVDTEYSAPCPTPAGGVECLPRDGIPFPEDDIGITFGGLRFDKYLAKGRQFTIEGGTTEYDGPVFINATARGQVNDVERPWGRFNFSAKHWNVLAYYNKREAMSTNLANGNPFLLDADNLKIELQTNWSFADDTVRLVGGGSYFEEDVDSNVMAGPSSIDDQALFAQVDWDINRQVKLVGAVRWDDSSLHDSQVSPKGSIVYSVNPKHTLRFTYNEAFQLPTYADFFLQFPLFPGPDLSPLNMICTQDPYNIDCGLGPTFNYLFGNEKLEVEEVTTLELGYKGILWNKTFLTIDFYDSKNENFVTNPVPVGLTDASIPPWMGPDDAEMTPIDPADCPATNFTSGSVADCVRATADETVPPPITNVDGSAAVALLSFSNLGRVDTQGADVGLSYFFNREWKLSFSYSWFDFDVKEDTGGLSDGVLLPNAPENKASLGLLYNKPRWDASIRGRWVDEFFWANGTYAGTVESFTTFDLSGNYAISDHWKVGLNVANLFEDEHWEAFGGDLLKRRALAHVAFSW